MAYENDILTRNDDDELSVRVVQSTGDNPAVAYDDVYTRDDNGKLAVRVVGAGGGGGDTHNKGYFATPEALRTAYPTAQPGDFAIVESTDTVWVWDSDGSQWKDGDTKGQVTSVNNQTGAVTLTASDVGAATAAQGAKADTAVQPGDLATVATTGAYSDLTGTPTIPTVGNGTITITQGGVTKGTFTTNQSGDSTIDVDAGGGGSSLPSQTGNSGKFLTTNGTDASWSDKPLVNTFSDSTSVGILSYEDRTYPRNVVIGTNIRYDAATPNLGDSVWIGASVNHPSLTSYWRAPNSVIIGSKAAAQENSVVVGYNARGGANNYATGSVCIGYQAGTNGGSSQVAVGYNSKAGYYSVAIGREASANCSPTYSGAYTIAIGSYASATAAGAIQIGKGTNSTGGTLQIGLSTGGEYGTTNQYVLLDTDGTIPADRLPNAINKYSTMPTAASTNEGWIVQYTGATDATYTHGYIYECVSDGGNPATYSWSAVSVQAGGGGSSLPSQTGNAGKFLTTDGTDAGWSDKPLVNKATGSSSLAIQGAATGGYSVVIGDSATCSSTMFANCVAVGNSAGAYGQNSISVGTSSVANNTGSLSIGGSAKAQQNYSLAIGYYSWATAAGAIQLGNSTSSLTHFENSDANTFKVGNANGNFEIMSADGTIPEARLADTTSATAGDVLTLDSNGNAVWQAGGGGGGATATTATLATANWSSNSQTVSVTGVTASNVVYVMAAPASAAEYAAAGVQCTAQASGTLTFTCTTTPSSALTVNIAIF